MPVATRAVVTAALAAVVAVAGYLGGLAVAIACGLLVVGIALGWPALADLPSRVGTSLVVGLGGLGAVAAVHLTDAQPYLRDLPAVFAGAVLLAFLAELARRDGRTRLVESVSGTVAGTLVAVAAAGWVAIGRSPGGLSLVVGGALALAVAAATVALAVPVWLGVVITVGSATAAGVLGSLPLPGMGLATGALLGLAVGILVAALHVLLDRLPALEDRWPAIAAVTLPVTVTGVLVYVVGRVLVG